MRRASDADARRDRIVPSRKPLKSVVRSLAESFTSLMNHRGDDYVMGHVVRVAWDTGSTGFHVDLLSGKGDPSPLLVAEVRGAVADYVRDFPGLVQRSGSSMEFVRLAEMKVTVDFLYLPEGSPTDATGTGVLESDDAEFVLRAQFQLFL